MLEKVSQAAERVATSVSRRAFLSKLGQRVLALTGVFGGLLVLPQDAEAAGGRRCCVYYLPRINAYTYECVPRNKPCPGYPSGQYLVQGCHQCSSPPRPL